MQKYAYPVFGSSYAVSFASLSMSLPAFRLIRRAETNNARDFTGTGIVAVRHKVAEFYSTHKVN